jgi:hypothetical protein
MTEASPAPLSESAPTSSPVDPCAIQPARIAQLSAPQQTALAALSHGRTIKDAATAAGVNRVTVGRWLRTDPRFRAAYNAWRQELIDSTRSRLLRTAELAAAAVHKQIAKGDGRLALALLDRLGLASEAAATAGPPDADLARDEIAVERSEQLHAVQRRVKTTREFCFWREDEEHLDALRRQVDEQPRLADDATE